MILGGRNYGVLLPSAIAMERLMSFHNFSLLCVSYVCSTANLQIVAGFLKIGL